MRSKRFWGFLLFCALWPVQAAAENRFIVRAPSGVGSRRFARSKIALWFSEDRPVHWMAR